MPYSINGIFDSKFFPVKEAFERNFDDLGEIGAALAIYWQGKKVIDLYGGLCDNERKLPWQPNTLVMPYSVCKPLVALTALILVDRELLDLEAPVTQYWPEFGQNGKSEVKVIHLLNHEAGIPAIKQPLETEVFYDWAEIIRLLELQKPLWEPGTEYAEHALFYGHLIGELVQRITGQNFRQFFEKEVAQKLGVEFYFGVPEAAQKRCAQITAFPEATLSKYQSSETAKQALFNPPGLTNPQVVNSAAWRSAQIPAVNGHGTADAVARIYSALANGGRWNDTQLLSPKTTNLIYQMGTPRTDRVFDSSVYWSAGVQLDKSGDFGLGGIGGSCGFGNHDKQFSFAYLTRQMKDFDRVEAIESALISVLNSL